MQRAAQLHLIAVMMLVPALTVLAAPDPLEVAVGRAEIDETTAFVKIAGTVKNNSQAWVCRPVVDIVLLDPSGQPLGVDSIAGAAGKGEGVVANRTWLPPGEVSVFEYIRDVKKLKGKTYASQRLKAHGRDCPSSRPQVALDAFVAAQPDLPASTAWAVSGTIKNTGSVACRSPKAVIGEYRADGTLYGATDKQPDETFQKMLQPGQTVDFTIKAIGGATDQIKEIRAWADCELVY